MCQVRRAVGLARFVCLRRILSIDRRGFMHGPGAHGIWAPTATDIDRAFFEEWN